MEEKIRLAVFGQKRLSREGGIEIVVKELCTRMAQNGCDITCYNRAGHHVSGAEYDKTIEYDGIRQKVVPTIEKKGARDIIRGCHNRDKGTAENERLRNLKFIFSYPKNERMIFLSGRKCRTGRNLDHEGGVTASGQVYEPIRSLCWPRC